MTWTATGRPAVRPEIQAIDVNGELVLWDPHNERVHRLDRIASLLWPFLDGEAAIEELAEDLAEVWAVSTDEATRSLLVLVDQLDRAGLIGPGRALPAKAPSTVVANPVRCGTDLSRWTWGDPLGLEVGGRTMSVRTTDAELASALEDSLGSHRTDPVDPSTYSVAVGEGSTDLHLLYWGHCLVARSASRHEILEHLLAHLAGHSEPRPGTVRIDGHVLARGTRGVLFLATDRSRLWSVAARLRSSGAALVPTAWVDIDASNGQFAPGGAPLEVEADVLTTWSGGRLVAPGSLRYVVDIVRIVLPLPLHRLRGSELVGAMSEHRLLADPARDLPFLAQFLGQVPVVAEEGGSLAELVSSVATVLAAPGS